MDEAQENAIRMIGLFIGAIAVFFSLIVLVWNAILYMVFMYGAVVTSMVTLIVGVLLILASSLVSLG